MFFFASFTIHFSHPDTRIIIINSRGAAVTIAQVFIVSRLAWMSIIVSGTNASITHQNRRRKGFGSSSFFSPIVEVVAIVMAAPSRVVAKNSRELMQNMSINIEPNGRDLSISMIAWVSCPFASMPLDDCSVSADLKLALAFQRAHPGVFLLGQKQPLVLAPAPQRAAGCQNEKFRHVPGIVLEPFHSQQVMAFQGEMQRFHALRPLS